MQFEKVNYGGWPHCVRLSDGRLELIITGDVGPRIIRFGFVDGPNEFYENPDTLGKMGGDQWEVYGGHRFWHAPEQDGRTNLPDNTPVTIEQRGDTVIVSQPIEAETRLSKQMEIDFSDDGAVRVVHRLTNHHQWAVAVAPWGVSVMASGGIGLLPLPPRGSHGENLLPNTGLVLWAYVDMSDPRWIWGRELVLLRQDTSATTPQKFGTTHSQGWAAYARDGRLFVKTFDHQAGATYPDLGCSAELYTDPNILEVETLGPLVHLAPNASIEHVEHWYLFDNVPTPNTEAEAIQDVLPRIQDIAAQGI